MIKLETKVTPDEITDEISQMFDYEFNGETVTEIENFTPPSEFNIGLIVGGSGTGKSTLLEGIGVTTQPTWDYDRAVCSHFIDAEEARVRLNASGFNSIPDYVKPFHVLSTGQKFRANLARQLRHGAVVDEFTSVVDRNVAKSASYAAQRYIRKHDIKDVVFASCHRDIVEWLDPDWVYDTDTGVLSDRGSLRQRPEIKIRLEACETKTWDSYSKHHYLTANNNKSSRVWRIVWESPDGDQEIGITCMLRFPHPQIKFAWRCTRVVILPEYQGLGIGTKIPDLMGEMVLSDGGRLFAKAANPLIGLYWESSSNWRPTTHNRQLRPEYKKRKNKQGSNPSHGSAEHLNKHADRLCWSMEYIGEQK